MGERCGARNIDHSPTIFIDGMMSPATRRESESMLEIDCVSDCSDAAMRPEAEGG